MIIDSDTHIVENEAIVVFEKLIYQIGRIRCQSNAVKTGSSDKAS